LNRSAPTYKPGTHDKDRERGGGKGSNKDDEEKKRKGPLLTEHRRKGEEGS